MATRASRFPPPRVVVLHNACGHDTSGASIRGVLDEAAAVAHACRGLGWPIELLPAPDDPLALLHALTAARPDVVFNLVEEYQGCARGEARIAALLDISRLPYTGSPPVALELALNKPLAKAVLRSHGIPVPRGVLLETGRESLAGLRFPCIVKLPCADASEGLSLESVVQNEAAARARARFLRKHYRQGALVEEFVDGREFEVAFLGDGSSLLELPLAELDYTGFPKGAPRLMTYDSKWAPDSVEYKGTRNIAPRGLPKALAARIIALARAGYRALGLRDYGRVDLRISTTRGPVVLEVNPNPDVAPGAALATALHRAEIPYPEFIRRTVNAALARKSVSRAGIPACQRGEVSAPPIGISLRPLKLRDRAPLATILRATKHFNDEEIAIALELIDDGLKFAGGRVTRNRWPTSPQGYSFVVAELNSSVAGYVCFGRTPFTDGAYDMYWIAVSPACARAGVGRALASAAERIARAAGGRVMVAETASKPGYADTRLFYERIGYREEARVRHFYAVDDDKILCVKRMR